LTAYYVVRGGVEREIEMGEKRGGKRRGKEEEEKERKMHSFYFLPIHSPERSEASIRKIGV
jgi:hypothetical protein